MTSSIQPEPARSNAPGGWLRWAPLLVVLVAWGAHASARQATWVLEDARLLRDNATVLRGASASTRLLARQAEPEATSVYGPLAMASFALEAPLWRRPDGTLAPRGLHLTNLLLHGLCAILLLQVLTRLFPRRLTVAVAGALVFAAHPVHAGTVTALAGRAQLLAVFFGLLTVLAWRAWAGRFHAWLPLAALAWLLALQASEAALGVPLLLLLLEIGRPTSPGPWTARLPALLVFVVPLALWWSTWPGIAPPAWDLPSQPVGERMVVGFEGLARTVWGLVLPVALRGDHTDEALAQVGYPVDAAALVLTGLCLLLGGLALAHAARGRAGLFSGSWLATLALAVPVFAVQPAGRALELTFAYAAGLPLFAAVGGVAQGLLGSPRRTSATAFPGVRAALGGAIGLLALGALAHAEAGAWQDDASFHQRLIERNPSHVRVLVRLARNQRRVAERLRATAAVLPAESPERAVRLAMRREALAASLAWARRAVSHEAGRRDADAWRELGFAQLGHDRIADALRSFEFARDCDPLLRQSAEAVRATATPRRLERAAETYYAIGRCQQALGSREAAAEAFRVAAQLDDDNAEYLRMAGLELYRAMRHAEGIAMLEHARRLSGDRGQRADLDRLIAEARRSARSASSRLVREGEAAQAEGEMRKAVTLYEQAVEIDPEATRAWIRAGWLRGMWFGNYAAAAQSFAAAEALLRKGRVPEDSLDWRQLRDFRHELEKQKAQEDADLEGGKDDR